MIKTVMDNVCVFDCEYAPCLKTGRRAYGLRQDAKDTDVLSIMYSNAPKDRDGRQWEVGMPPPMLKTLFYEVVAVAAVFRLDGGKKLALRTLAKKPEAEIVGEFLGGVGKHRCQLIGFASERFDVPVLAQRALVHGLTVPPFFERPGKPWEGGDYFGGRLSDWHVDLIDLLGSDGKTKPKLDEICRACGIPGKLGPTGHDVAALWWSGNTGQEEVIRYNEEDACSTYLLWLRMAALGGLVDYKRETENFRTVLNGEAKAGRPHLNKFLDAWEE